MTLHQFLSTLREKGIQLRVDGDQLRYNAPTGVLSAEMRDELRGRKPEILAFLAAAKKQSQAAAVPPIIRFPRDRGGRLPLSFAQERMWFIDQLQPGYAGHNMSRVALIKGMLSAELLERVINEVIRRHEVLRTTFEMAGVEPVQVVHPHQCFKLSVIDLTDVSEEERMNRARQLVQEEGVQPFDLTRDLMVRVKWLKLGNDDNAIVYTMHHIASDGWSMGVLNRETVLLYEAFAAGRPSPLPDLPIQYSDFAVWQRGWLRGEVLQNQLQFWKKQLAGMTSLQFPSDYPRPPVYTFRGGAQKITIRPEVEEGLKQLSQREGVTLFMTMLAGLQLLLSRYCGQEDIAVGVPIANRNWPEIEGLIGFFVNTLILRTDISGDPTVAELLARVKQVTLEAYEHQDLPFEKLVEELKPERDLSWMPLVQVMFAFHNVPTGKSPLAGLTAQDMCGVGVTARFDLEWTVSQEGEELTAAIVYNADLFEAATIRRMARHWEQLLGEMIKDTSRRTGRLEAIDGEERSELIEGWNNTSRIYLRETCVHELFEQRAQQRPDAIAVDDAEAQLSYGELNRRANRVAHYLRELGVGPDVPVGLCLDRGLEMLIGSLGVLKAGGAYLPLDPAYPAERLAFSLNDAGAAVLLTQCRWTEKLSQLSGTTIICLDAARKELKERSTENLKKTVGPQNLAYLIYTSGSTGRPKGVELVHEGLTNLVEWHTERYGIGPNEYSSQVASIGFDAATWEIWPPLAAGARICVVPEAVRNSAASLQSWIAERGITIGFLPTPLAEMLIGVDWGKATTLKTLLTGGDRLSRYASSSLPFTVMNHYGPTESTVVATCAPVSADGGRDHPPPIGRPIANTRVYILDDCFRPLPVGATGELLIAGDGLARGYHGCTELTAEKFVPDPFSRAGGQRLYRTGDWGCYRADGEIEFVGRMDHQVKLRGFRVELGEIENVLRMHPLVRDAIIQAQGNEGNRRLIGYVVLDFTTGNSSASMATVEAQIRDWKIVFDDIYQAGASASADDPTFNFRGWNSSFTGAPMPVGEMREWLDNTVTEIRELNPRRVLEIGCGTGMVLFPVASGCEEYWATDFSSEALAQIDAQWKSTRHVNNRLKLFHRAADDFSSIEEGQFCGVILNSVVQYFPDAEYLARVLEGAAKVVKRGGFIFIGDVRSLPLLESFHASVQLHRLGDSLGIKCFKQEIQMQMARENELALAPSFFFALQRRLPEIRHVEIRPKFGQTINELTRFRYQVVLHIGEEPPLMQIEHWEASDVAGWTGTDVSQFLREHQPKAVGIRGLGNRRLWNETGTLNWLKRVRGDETVRDLREHLGGSEPVGGLAPEELREIANEHGYHVEISWAAHDEQGKYDVAFWRRNAGDDGNRVRIVFPDLAGNSTSVASTNQPSRGTMTRQMIPLLQDYLYKKLPEHMVPSAFVVLDALPLTTHGKVDRAALPMSDAGIAEKSHVEPRNDLEATLVDIWKKVLKVQRVGVYDNFFELGGHSLRVTQVASLIEGKFAIKLPVADLYSNPTIEGLAGLVAKAQVGAALKETAGANDQEWKQIDLHESIRPLALTSGNFRNPEAVFVTGASGFLGTFLVQELLEQTNATVYCLVRAENDAAARAKLLQALARCEVPPGRFDHRLKAICGDLAAPQLGLSRAARQNLARTIDVIYHNGAVVNFVQPFGSLKGANVSGTEELLRIACEEKTKAFHYVSTLSVFGARSYSADEIEAAEPPPLNQGYSQSKWTAERLVRSAGKRGLPVAIYRPSRIVGDTVRGISNCDDLASRFIKGCVQLGLVPDRGLDMEVPDNWVPVDYASAAIVAISLQTIAFERPAFHICNPVSLDVRQLFRVLRQRSVGVISVGYGEWRFQLGAAARTGVNNALLPLLSSFPEVSRAAGPVLLASPSEMPPLRNTEEAIANSGIQCPPIDDELLEKYFTYFERVGFLRRESPDVPPQTNGKSHGNGTHSESKPSVDSPAGTSGETHKAGSPLARQFDTQNEDDSGGKSGGRILIVIFPEYSAYNSSFVLARRLSERGHRITYVTEPKFENYVRENGFDPLVFRGREEFRKRSKGWKRYGRWAKAHARATGIIEAYEQWVQLVENWMQDEPVELVIMEPILCDLSPPILKRGIPIMGLNPNLAGVFDDSVPPITSGRAEWVDRGMAGRLAVWVDWMRHVPKWLKTRFVVPLMLFLVLGPVLYRQRFPRHLIGKYGGRLRWGEYGCRLDVPELVMVPREFDFPRARERNNWCYAGACVDTARPEPDLSGDVRNETYPFIYCSLGTYGHQYRDRRRLLTAMIEVARRRPQWRFLIHAGKGIAVERLRRIPENMQLATWVPQLSVLRRAAIFVTHGGLGSIRESLYYGVPMIVFPCRLDQQGNSARVVFHGLGLRGDIARVEPAGLLNLMEQVLSQPSFREAVSRMQSVFQREESCRNGADFVEAFLNSHRVVFEPAPPAGGVQYLKYL